MNQDVLDMIARLHARLDDVTAVVKSCDEDLEGYAKRLDKIDDQIYLIEVEIEKRIKLAHTDSDEAKADSKENLEQKENNSLSSSANETNENAQFSSDKKEDSISKRQFISEDMKENLGDATRALGAIYRDGREAVSELTDAMSDIKSTFDIKGKVPRRRRH